MRLPPSMPNGQRPRLFSGADGRRRSRSVAGLPVDTEAKAIFSELEDAEEEEVGQKRMVL